MKSGILCVGAAALLIAGSVFAQDSTGAIASVPAVSPSCPAKSMSPPVYPTLSMVNNEAGTAIVSVALDACGRVVDAKIAKGSGTTALDGAALDAARAWVLGTPGAADKIVEGRREIPVHFGIKTRSSNAYPPPAKATPAAIGWPSTHSRPRYIADNSGEFASVVAAERAARAGANRPYAVPYPGVGGVFLAEGSEASPEYWLLAQLSQWNQIAVRYRPVMENGEPVVHMLLVCDDGPSRCARNLHTLMHGLPFAEAKQP